MIKRISVAVLAVFFLLSNVPVFSMSTAEHRNLSDRVKTDESGNDYIYTSGMNFNDPPYPPIGGDLNVLKPLFFTLGAFLLGLLVTKTLDKGGSKSLASASAMLTLTSLLAVPVAFIYLRSRR